MKAISAAIIVLAASALLLGGAFIKHYDTKTTVQLAGGIMGLVALVAWYKEMGKD